MAMKCDDHTIQVPYPLEGVGRGVEGDVVNKRLRCYAVRYSFNFSCARSWWHRLWNKITIEERGPGGTWCAHEVWTYTCGERWKVDRSYIEGVMHVTAFSI